MRLTLKSSSRWIRAAAFLIAAVVVSPVAQAQDPAAPDATKPAKPEQLQQLVAPVALYPDSLLSQILMASTYPLEVVEAARWTKGHAVVQGKALEDAMQEQSWDASVKSLTAFPQVLAMMNDKLHWTIQLGDAFLSNKKELMDAVQVLRQKAKSEGNLKSNDQQKITVTVQPLSANSASR